MPLQSQLAELAMQLASAVIARNSADKMHTLNQLLRVKYDIIRVGRTEEYYYKTKNSFTYEKLSSRRLTNMVRDVYLAYNVSFSSKDLSNSASLVRDMVTEEVEEVSRDVVEIAPGYYWDARAGHITRKPRSYCFHKLFDTTYTNKHTVLVEPFSAKEVNYIMDKANLVRRELEETHDLKERFEFIKTWANGSHDVYMDIIRAIAYCFLYKKPVGSYILIGKKRNGKSSFIGLLHTIFGRDNTSMVKLSQLGDAHYATMLMGSVLNAPDEEDEKSTQYQAEFKTMSDHGVLTLPRLFSNEPFIMSCDFMGFYAHNHLPTWQGSGAAACMKRSLIIPFNADLSRYDTASDNFAERTFTKETMRVLMGEVFGIAMYYSKHDLEFSNTMTALQEGIGEEIDNVIRYRAEFEKCFDGFQSFDFLYKDYKNWCIENQMQASSKRELVMVFLEYKERGLTREYNKATDETIAYYCIPKDGRRKLIASYGLPDCSRDMGEFISNGESVLNWLQRHEEENGPSR